MPPPSMTFDVWTVALARFPYAETSRDKARPVVIQSAPAYAAAHDLLIVLMVTSGAQDRWSSDHDIVDLAAAGLTRPSVVRYKLATIPSTFVYRRLGALSPDDRAQVSERLVDILPNGHP